MNVPNAITFLRLLLIPPFMVFTFIDNVWTRIMALGLFILAGLTDFIDGYLARKYNKITVLGVFMDPLADKFLISAAFVSFVQMPEIHVPAWMVIIIIGREFFITGLRTLAAYKGRIMPSDKAGKFKTTSQIVAIIAILVILSINSFMYMRWGLEPEGLLHFGGWRTVLGWTLKTAPYWLTFITAIFTMISGLSYFKKNNDLFRDPAIRGIN